MDREKIERLAMDSAAGELNEDVKALLQEYLAEHSQAKKWFLEMQETYSNTQAAFDVKTAYIKKTSENKPSLKFDWLPFLRIAAIVVISVCTGIAAGRWSKQNVPQQESELIVKTPAVSAKRDSFSLDNLGEGFWRNKITAMLNPSPTRVHIEKSSGRSLLEQYQQYLKERNHE
ncbi:MAG: hypothetical protein JW787_05435 [Sedimentisphaerales bacterium]|nr:hypothetical protein [Sedimentisphaerales bacterium]